VAEGEKESEREEPEEFAKKEWEKRDSLGGGKKGRIGKGEMGLEVACVERGRIVKPTGEGTVLSGEALLVRGGRN